MCSSFPSARLWLYQNGLFLLLGACLPWRLAVGGGHFCIFVQWIDLLTCCQGTEGTRATPPMAQDPISAPSATSATALPSHGHCRARSALVPAQPCALLLSLWGCPGVSPACPTPSGGLRQALPGAVMQFYCAKAGSGFSSDTVL